MWLRCTWVGPILIVPKLVWIGRLTGLCNYFPRGPPRLSKSTYTKEVADRICELIEQKTPIYKIGQMEDMPTCATIYRWLRTFPEFEAAYSISKRIQLETLAEEIIEIADDGSNDKNSDGTTNHANVNRARLMVDSRKFVVERLMPEKFGNKIKNEVSGPNGGPVATTEVSKEDLARLIAFTASKEDK